MVAKKRTNVASDKPDNNDTKDVKKLDKKSKSKKTSKSDESGVEKVRGWVYVLIFICMGGFIANKVFNVYEKNTIQPIGDFVEGTKGHLLNYWCDGPSTSENVVIFVEDAATSYFQSWKFLKSISESVRVCAYDRTGRGFSDSPAGAITANDTLTDLEIIVKTVAGTKPVVFVGHGFGSLLSTVYSLNHTGQVKGLVLFNPVGPGHYDNGNGEAVFGALRPWFTVAEMGTITGLMRVVEYLGFVKGWGYEFYPEVASVLKYNLNQQRVFLVGTFEMDGLQKDLVSAYKNSTKSTIGSTPVKIVNSEQYNSHLSEFANSLWTKTRDDKALKSLSTDVETVTLSGTWNDFLVVKHEETAAIVNEFIRQL